MDRKETQQVRLTRDECHAVQTLIGGAAAKMRRMAQAAATDADRQHWTSEADEAARLAKKFSTAFMDARNAREPA